MFPIENIFIGYYNPLSDACKEGFEKFFQIFQKKAQRRKHQPHETPGEAEKSAEQPQNERAERQKIQNGGQKNGQEHIQAKLAAAGGERERQKRGRERKPKQEIRGNGGTRRQLPQRAQRVIQPAQRQPQKHTLRKGQRLRRDRQLHQPKSLAKKPPRGISSS